MNHRNKCCAPSRKSCSKNDCINLLQSITPTNDFSFKILTNMTNTLTSDGNVQNVAVTQYILDICNREISFNNICCPTDEMSTIILGIPLIFLNKCSAYRMILPDISDATSFDYSDFIIVENADQTILPVDLQVANGYLNVIIVISSASTESENGCQINLTFTKFNFSLTKSLVFCTSNLICYPVTWKYGLTSFIVPITTLPITTEPTTTVGIIGLIEPEPTTTVSIIDPIEPEPTTTESGV